jgi:hypothetical protein
MRYLSTRKMVEVVARHWVDITMEELTQGLRLLRLLYTTQTCTIF